MQMPLLGFFIAFWGIFAQRQDPSYDSKKWACEKKDFHRIAKNSERVRCNIDSYKAYQMT